MNYRSIITREWLWLIGSLAAMFAFGLALKVTNWDDFWEVVLGFYLTLGAIRLTAWAVKTVRENR